MIAIKRWIGSLLIVVLCLPLSGCWDYRGLNKISIVTGVAIDRQEESRRYHLTIETIDFSAAGKESAGKPQIVETEGTTIYDAVRNAKKRLAKKLYFGDIKVIVISSQIAREEGINSVLDWFLRDIELRQTATPIISQEKTAKEILTANGVDDKIISEEIEKMIDDDKKNTASTKKVASYQVFDVLQGDKETSLLLPAIHCIPNQEKKVVELNGVAVFKEDKLQGYLSPEETHYYLFGADEIAGGIITFPFAKQESRNQDNFSLEITNNKTKKSYTYDGNRIKVLFDIKTAAYLGEAGTELDDLKMDTLEKIRSTAALTLTQKIENVIKKGQLELGCDIFGVGTMIHKSDPALWYKLRDNWAYYVQTIEVEIRPELVILNTGMTK